MSAGLIIRDFRQNNDIEMMTSSIRFVAHITYKTPSKTYTGNSNVRIDIAGINDCNVHLTENEDFSDEILHLDFNPTFQNYRYDQDDNVLIISGNSSKIGGDYTVSIRCISRR